jgi:tRNA threonylcarbamoyladenosine biosynthesis protein TsaE
MESSLERHPFVQFKVHGPSETAKVAEKLAPLLRLGDVLLLDGDLAAGKTYFTKALLEALRSGDTVTSPTYALVHVYKAPIGTVAHADSYRIDGLAEFRDLGLEDYTDNAITVVEWGSKVRELYPNALSIRFESVGSDPNERLISLSADASRWTPVLSGFAGPRELDAP